MTIRSVGRAVLVLAAVTFVPLGSAQAEGLSKGLYQARMLDVCLYDQWNRRKEKDGILAECRCASKAYVVGLDKEALADALKTGKLSSSGRRDLMAAHAKCRKK